MIIKYLGSKRLLVGVLGRHRRGGRGAHRARPVHRHDPGRPGAQVTRAARHRHRPRHLQRGPRRLLRRHRRRDGRRRRRSRRARRCSRRCPGSGYVTETFCDQARYFQPHNGARIDAIRDAIERDHRRRARWPDPAHRLLDAADRVDSTTGVQMAYLKRWAPRSYNDLDAAAARAAPRARARPCAATRSSVVDALDGRPGLPRPALQPAPLLRQLPRLGDPGPLGRAGALRRRLQARRLRARGDQERLQPQARDAAPRCGWSRASAPRWSSSRSTTSAGSRPD